MDINLNMAKWIVGMAVALMIAGILLPIAMPNWITAVYMIPT